MKWFVGFLICMIGAVGFVLTQGSARIERIQPVAATPAPTPSPLALEPPVPRPTPGQLQPMPEGVYCMLERVSMTTDSGITAIPAGATVHRLKADASGLTVTDGSTIFHVKLSQVTNDPAVAARIGQTEAQKSAALAAWQQSQTDAVQAKLDARNAAFAKIAALQDSSSVEWLTDYQLALQQAKAGNKKLLLDFTGSDWCPVCMKTEADIFSKREFMDYAAKNLVLVKLDYPNMKIQPEGTKAQNERLLSQYNISGYPTLVLLDQNGTELGRMSGYYTGGLSVYITEFERWSFQKH